MAAATQPPPVRSSPGTPRPTVAVADNRPPLPSPVTAGDTHPQFTHPESAYRESTDSVSASRSERPPSGPGSRPRALTAREGQPGSRPAGRIAAAQGASRLRTGPRILSPARWIGHPLPAGGNRHLNGPKNRLVSPHSPPARLELTRCPASRHNATAGQTPAETDRPTGPAPRAFHSAFLPTAVFPSPGCD